MNSLSAIGSSPPSGVSWLFFDDVITSVLRHSPSERLWQTLLKSNQGDARQGRFVY